MQLATFLVGHEQRLQRRDGKVCLGLPRRHPHLLKGTLRSIDAGVPARP